MVRGQWSTAKIEGQLAGNADTWAQAHNFLVGNIRKKHKARVHTTAGRRLPNASGSR